MFKKEFENMENNERERAGNIICGRNPVLEAVRSGREIDRLLVAHGVSGGSVAAIIAKCRAKGVLIKEVSPQKLDYYCGGANHQGVAVVNYTEREIPYTRIIEHKHFESTVSDKTVITREYPADWKEGMEPYYPINDERNTELFGKYKELADKKENMLFGGRLAEYKYYDMDKVIASALELTDREFGK